VKAQDGEFISLQNDALVLPATLSAGVHLGDTIFGMAGPEGDEQYVAFGDTVSITERLVHRARPGRTFPIVGAQ
jgi:class 3 adenylate cyclase